MSTKPDFDNYMERITAIQKVIITGSQAAKYPYPSSPKPFWLNVSLPDRIRPNADNQSSVLTYNIRMILVRTTKENMFNPDYELQIGKDITEVVWNFMTDNNYRRFIVSTYTAIQPGFIPGSVKISNYNRIEGVQNVGEFLGSIYTLEWQHRMQRTVGT